MASEIFAKGLRLTPSCISLSWMKLGCMTPQRSQLASLVFLLSMSGLMSATECIGQTNRQPPLQVNTYSTDGSDSDDITDRSNAEWLRLLSHSKFDIREQTERELNSVAAKNIPFLNAAAQSSNPEIAWRSARVLRGLSAGDWIPSDPETIAVFRRSHPALYNRSINGIRRKLREQGIIVNENSAKSKSATVTFSKNSRVSDDSIKQLALFSPFQKIDFRNSNLTDAQLSILGKSVDVSKIYLFDTKVTGSGLEQLSLVKDLKILSARQLKLDPIGFESIGKFKELESLGLDETNIDDVGLQHLEGLSKLKSIWLNDTPITDKGLETLAKLSNLRRLYLPETQLTARGIKHLIKLQKLEYLSLQGVPIGDGSMTFISRLRNLKSLGLDQTRVTDAGVAKLKHLSQLEILWLTSCDVGDESIDSIAMLQNLRELHVRYTQFTERGLRKLQMKLPRCEISFARPKAQAESR